MFTGVFGSFISERRAPWFFAVETAAAIAVAVLFWAGVVPGGTWPAAGFVWYATYCAMLYFHWDRRRTLKRDEPWKPSVIAKATAIICFALLGAVGAGLAYASFGVRVQVAVIGLVLVAIAILQMIGIAKRGWPRLGL